MRTIHVSQASRHYFIDGIYWGDDVEGVLLYLRVIGVSPDEIAKALEGVAQAGTYMIQQECMYPFWGGVGGEPREGVVQGHMP
jgi:hypothetical protein